MTLTAAVPDLAAWDHTSSPVICSASALSTGAVDAICQRASEALAGPHCHLQDWVLDQDAVHVDETGWRTRGEGRALWTATTPSAVFLQIAERCNREQFNALIGTEYPGIVVSDRWNGYSHLDPARRQVCWSHLQRDFRRHADGLGEQKTFGEQGVELTQPRVRRLAHLPARAPRPPPTPSRDRADPDRAARSCSRHASPKKARNRWHRQFANNLLKVWPALWTFVSIDGVEPTNNPAERALRAPVIHRKVSLGTQSQRRRAVRRTRPVRRRAPAANNTAPCSPTSANSSPPTTAATHSPPWPPEAPRTERLQAFLMPPSLREWLAEDHLAWFVIETVAGWI